MGIRIGLAKLGPGRLSPGRMSSGPCTPAELTLAVAASTVTNMAYEMDSYGGYRQLFRWGW